VEYLIVKTKFTLAEKLYMRIDISFTLEVPDDGKYEDIRKAFDESRRGLMEHITNKVVNKKAEQIRQSGTLGDGTPCRLKTNTGRLTVNIASKYGDIIVNQVQIITCRYK